MFFLFKGSQEAIHKIKKLRISHNCGEFIHKLTTKSKLNLVEISIALIAGSNVKAIRGLWIYSVANSVGKSTFTLWKKLNCQKKSKKFNIL